MKINKAFEVGMGMAQIVALTYYGWSLIRTGHTFGAIIAWGIMIWSATAMRRFIRLQYPKDIE